MGAKRETAATVGEVMTCDKDGVDDAGEEVDDE